MAEQETIVAVLNAWRGRGPYHDQMRGVIAHRWPRLAMALERLDSEEHVTAAAGIAVVARAMDPETHHRQCVGEPAPQTAPCPDCRDGKHTSCAGFAVDHADEQVPCPCELPGHREEP